ncbi:MAG: HEPN domain-containing protein [Coleofasciculus sp. S288]|nr:HEPN domain-containing protein [Coleofasciculus sp. S288]
MTPEQQALLEKATRSLQAAKVLNQQNLPEFAASRAYYTMFYIASAFLEGEGLAFSRHSAVISAFGREFANTGRVHVEFHRYLIAAEQIRRQADYNIAPELTQAQAAEQILRAQQFLELAEQLLSSPPPP